MSDLIDRQALYERAATLEAQALDYVGKLIERDGDEPSVEWKVWSAILTERTAFKHDVFDAPSVQPERKKGKWIEHTYEYGRELFDCETECSICGYKMCGAMPNYCPDCGADMRGEKDETDRR